MQELDMDHNEVHSSSSASSSDDEANTEDGSLKSSVPSDDMLSRPRGLKGMPQPGFGSLALVWKKKHRMALQRLAGCLCVCVDHLPSVPGYSLPDPSPVPSSLSQSSILNILVYVCHRLKAHASGLPHASSIPRPLAHHHRHMHHPLGLLNHSMRAVGGGKQARVVGSFDPMGTSYSPRNNTHGVASSSNGWV
eukprot:676835-Pelagomonas_calceolata.AAC.1